MRRPSVTSWAGRFTSRSSPPDVLRPGQAASFSHALACNEVVGRPLPSVAAPRSRFPNESPPYQVRGRLWGELSLSSPPLRLPRPASDRGWSASFVNPITEDSRRGCRAGQLPKGGVHARQRGPSPLTAGPPGLTAHPNPQGSFPSGGGPSSLPAGGRRPKPTQHRRRTDR